MNNWGFDYKFFLKNCTMRSGVYRMLDVNSDPLYIGKAKNLKRRLADYFSPRKNSSPKTSRLVKLIAKIEITITENEVEALLFEQTLIKKWMPPYNVILRDDKSYPYVFLSEGEYPSLKIYRGKKNLKGRYFGPYPNVGAIRESLNFLQKNFMVRQCDDNFFKHRSRPCLQHQIKRCKAPCVKLVSTKEYKEDIECSVMFLEGRSTLLLNKLQSNMDKMAAALRFEEAASIRDKLYSLSEVQTSQSMECASGDLDIIAAVNKLGESCIHVLSIREGRVIGSKNFLPSIGDKEEIEEILLSFLGQYYISQSDHPAPTIIVINIKLKNITIIESAIRKYYNRKNISIEYRTKGLRSRWLDLALNNAEESLNMRLNKISITSNRFEELRKILSFKEIPRRLECYDISHFKGEATIGSCIVLSPEGPIRSEYKNYRIVGIKSGDDYAAMRQVLMRRFQKKKEERLNNLPNILVIDGGKGQVAIARDVLKILDISSIVILGIAKGRSRKPGLETLYLGNKDVSVLIMRKFSPAFHLIQEARDEAHLFAAKAHRLQRDKTRRISKLENIAGIGPVRRKKLLNHFGGLQALSESNIEEISGISGISKNLAKSIYIELHH